MKIKYAIKIKELQSLIEREQYKHFVIFRIYKHLRIEEETRKVF